MKKPVVDECRYRMKMKERKEGKKEGMEWSDAAEKKERMEKSGDDAKRCVQKKKKSILSPVNRKHVLRADPICLCLKEYVNESDHKT